MPTEDGTALHAGRMPDRDATVVSMLRAAGAVSYTHLRAHETVLDIVCRLLLEKKNESRVLLLRDVLRIILTVFSRASLRDHSHSCILYSLFRT